MGDKKRDIKVIASTSDCRFIFIDRKAIRVVDTNTGKISCKAVTLLPELQVELGENISELESVVGVTRIPVYLLESSGVNYGDGDIEKFYQVIRYQTGSIPEFIICTLHVVHDKINGVIFNKEASHDERLVRFGCIPIIARLSIYGNSNEDIKLSAAKTVKAVSTVPFDKYKVEVLGTRIVVSVPQSTKKGNVILEYTYLRDTENPVRYNLLGVELR